MSGTPRQPSDDLDDLFRGRASEFISALTALQHARLSGMDAGPAIEDLARLFAATGATADLLGRERVIEYAKARGVEIPREATLPGAASVPRGLANVSTDLAVVPFDEMVRDITTRTPELARTASDVAAVYERHGFALARSADITVTRRVLDALHGGMADGLTREESIRRVREAAPDFSQAYAETVYRNAVSNAYTAGTFEQMDLPGVAAVIVALRLSAIGDSRTSSICEKCDGTVAPKDHPIWNVRSVPLHHNCRSSMDFVSQADAERWGLWDEESETVRPHIPNPHVSAAPGFGRRPVVAA